MGQRVLLLGLGFWGRRWLELIVKTGRCELAGVAGSREELAATQALHGLPGDRCFLDYREAIASTDATLAVVVIPAALHADAARRSLAKGLHVLMEKPLALDIDEARSLLAAKAERPSLSFMVSQNYRWRPHNQAIKRAIAEGLIGKVETISVEFRKQEDLQGYRAGLERPLLQDVCIHHFDLVRFFSGSDCDEVYCRTFRPSWSEFAGEPNVSAVMRMTDGIAVSYEGSWAARGKETSWDGDFTITGDKGCLVLRADDSVTFFEHRRAGVSFGPSREEGRRLAMPAPRFAEMEAGLHLLLDSIEGGLVPETSVEDNFRSFAMVAAALESVSLKRPVSCPR